MSLILRPPWTSQPQVPVGIDWSNPLTRGLKFAWIAPQKRNAVNGNALTGTVPLAPVRVGIANNFTAASSQYLDAGTGKDVTFTGDMTVLSWYRLKTSPATNDGYILFAKDNSSGGRSYTFDVVNSAAGESSSGVRFYINGGGTLNTNALIEGRYTLAGDERLVGAVWQPSANRAEIWVNGVISASAGAVTTPPSSTVSARIGARAYSSYEDYMNGYIPFVFAWERGLSQQEMSFLSANPWQIFQPLPRRIFVDVVAGGPTYTLTAASGSLTLAGTSTGLSAARKLLATSNAITLTGTTTGLKVSRKITASTSAVTLTGTATGLTYTPVGGPTHTLTALPGAFSLTGIGTGLAASRKLLATTNAITLTGSSANLNYSVGLTDSQKIDYIYQALISGSLASDIAQATLSAAQATPIHANVQAGPVYDLAKRDGLVSGVPVTIPAGDGSIVAGDVEIAISTDGGGNVTLERVA